MNAILSEMTHLHFICVFGGIKPVDKSRLLCYKGIMKNKLVLENACSYRGADMGMPNKMPADMSKPIKLNLQRLKWVDGDYIENGAYFGGGMGDYIYCAFSENVQYFVRAKTHNDAKALVIEAIPKAKFYN